MFFTKITDLTGYNGGLTPAHLWFLLFLFVISLVALPLIIAYKKSGKKINENKIRLCTILPLFLFNFSLSILEISGQSFGKYLSFFLLGYFVLSTNTAMKLLEDNRRLLTILAIIFSALRMSMIYTINFKNVSFEINFLAMAFNHLTTWVIVLAILGLGKCYLDFSNSALHYFSKASFPIYIFHQTWLVAIGYYVINAINNGLIQFSIIMILTFIASVLTYEIIRLVPIARFMFGLKNSKNKCKK